MRNNIPSIKTLETAFPTKGKVLRRLLQSASAVREHPAAMARERECYNPPSLSDLRMHALDAELETFGVEYVQGNDTRRSPSFDYCNTGDSYGVTIIRFSDGRYRVGDWGTIVEGGNYV
jgi:hypothetical protein